MNTLATIRLSALGALLIVLSGCATYPVSESLRKQAKPVTLKQALEQPDASRGTTVIWGGRIVSVDNTTNGADLYILELPLDHYERPVARGHSYGRFIATSAGFADPEVYKPGHLVTVAGELAGVKTEPLQKVHYTYPVMHARELRVWPPPQEIRYYYPVWDGYHPKWYWGGPYPGWEWGWYAPWWY